MSLKQFVQKHAIACTVGALLLGAGTVVVGSKLVNRVAYSGINTTAPVPVSVDEAKKITEDHTGVSGLNFHHLVLEHDDDYPNPHYEIEAHKDGVEYDLDIDSVTGEVLAYSTENHTNAQQNQVSTSRSSATNSNTQTSENQTSQTILDEAKVKEIATKETGKTDLNFAYIRLETDDGRQVYDVKATSGNTKYDLDIDAHSGAILQSEQESISSTNTNTSGAKLSENDIKDIATKTSGKSKLNFTKIRLSQEADDYAGALIYEVTAYADGIEYELDIDANDGRVLSSSAEKENDLFD